MTSARYSRRRERFSLLSPLTRTTRRCRHATGARFAQAQGRRQSEPDNGSRRPSANPNHDRRKEAR